MAKAYYHTQESVDEYIRLARDVNGDGIISKLKNYLPDNSTLLELGSGPGTDWQILDQSYQVTGSDLSLVFLDHLRKSFPKGTFLHIDAVSLETHASFQGIYSNKVLHHLTDDQLKSSIQRQCDILNPGGIICHSFWKGEGSETFNGMFVNNHLEEGLRAHFGMHFDILALESYAEFKADDSLLLIGKKAL